MTTILVVDDEAMVLNLCSMALREHGFEVISVSNGIQSLSYFEEGRTHIDLALLDVVMAGLNDFELSKRIHQLSPSTKILFMSGCTPAEITRVIGKDMANHRSIWKPFTADSLVRMIGNVLGSAQAGADGHVPIGQ